MTKPKGPAVWPPKEETVLPLLKPEEREFFLTLDPEIRRFLLGASEKEREIFLALPPLEMFRFPKLSAEERKAYLRLGPKEKALLTQLGDDDWQRYVGASPEERQKLASGTRAGQAQAQQSQKTLGKSAEITRQLEEAFAPWTEEEGARSRMGGALYNALAGGAGDEDAWSAGVKALLFDPGLQSALVQALAEKIPEDKARRAQNFLPQLIEEASREKTRDAFVAHVAADVQSGRFDARAKSAEKAADLAASLKGALKGHISG